MKKKIRVADFVANFIKSLGVRSVFMISGGGAMFLNDAIGRCKGLDYIPNHNEQATSISAEAYSRVNENIGVAVVTTGPGGTNAITGVAGAWIDSVPLLIISGQVKKSNLMNGKGVRQLGPQEVDIISIVKPITKYAVTVMKSANIRYELEKAVFIAKNNRKGPVWVDIPLDIQAARINPNKLNSFKNLSVNKYKINNKLIANVTKMIKESGKPIILAGNGIRLSGAAKKFTKLYKKLNIPVVTTWNAMDLIPASNRLSIGKPGTVALRAPNFAVQNSDLLISIGARLDNVVTAFNPKNFAKNAKKILVDIDEAELNKFKFPIELRIKDDAKNFINNLLIATKNITPKQYNDWVAECNFLKNKYTINDGKPFLKTGKISHYHLVDQLSKLLPEGALIVTGSSGLGIEFFYTAFKNKKNQRIFHTSGLGAMGYGLPAMVGASQVKKNRLVIGIESDGSFNMNLQELLTIKALNLNLKIFIINNNGYASIRSTQRNYFNSRYVGTGFEAKLFLPDITDVAKSIGIKSFCIEKVEDLSSAIKYCLRQKNIILCDIKVINDENLWPKVSAIPQSDGSIISMPIEDMSPLLPIKELKASINKIDPISYRIRGIKKNE